MTNREQLIQKIRPQEGAEIVVSLEDFFTGNGDRGSIGCNLGSEQPPIAEFYRVLRAIGEQSTVQDVLVRIYDHSDPTSWPYSDTIYILTSEPAERVKEWVAPLLPSEVNPGWMYGAPPAAPALRSDMTAYSVWWD